MIKVNRLRSAAQAARLAPRIDIAGIGVDLRDPEPAPPFVSVAAAKAIVGALPGRAVAATLAGGDALGPAEVDAVLAEIGATHLELVPADPAKTEAHAAELAKLRAVRAPKIAGGFFLLPDDLGFADDPAPWAALRAAGVAWFQVEVSSAVGAPRFTPAQLRRIDAFLATIPALVTDQVTALGGYPLAAPAGFFFDLELPDGTAGGLPGPTWAESRLLRLLNRR